MLPHSAAHTALSRHIRRHVIRFNSHALPSDTGLQSKAEDASALYAQLYPLVFSQQAVGCVAYQHLTDAQLASRFADCFDQLGTDLGLPMRLRDVGIVESDVPRLAAEAMKQTRLLPNNPREMTLAHATDLYSRAY